MLLMMVAMATICSAGHFESFFEESEDDGDSTGKVLMTLVDIPISSNLMNALLVCLERVDAPLDVMEAMESLAQEAARLNGEI